MSGRWPDLYGGGESSQDFTQATQEESALGEMSVVEWCRSRGDQHSKPAAVATHARSSKNKNVRANLELRRLGRFSWGDSQVCDGVYCCLSHAPSSLFDHPWRC